MKQIYIQSLLGLSLALSLTGCKYSNEFTGNFNGEQAKLSAFGKVDADLGGCIELTLKSGSSVLKNSISASEAVNHRSLGADKSFNTKNSRCSANSANYLIGTRSVEILSTETVNPTEHTSMSMCSSTVYSKYHYQEVLKFEVRSRATDELVGTFSGTSLEKQFNDLEHPSAANLYPCAPQIPSMPGNQTQQVGGYINFRF